MTQNHFNSQQRSFKNSLQWVNTSVLKQVCYSQYTSILIHIPHTIYTETNVNSQLSHIHLLQIWRLVKLQKQDIFCHGQHHHGNRKSIELPLSLPSKLPSVNSNPCATLLVILQEVINLSFTYKYLKLPCIIIF